MNNSIYSYDIFDTCLVRACGEPSHVWDILAHKILGESADFAQIADFVLIRRSAEGKAREELISHEKEDVTIEDIYTYCDFSSLTDISKHDIMEEEMAVEEKMLIPVYSVLLEINQLHQEGKRVTFISDMYLPQSFIQHILITTGFFHEEDHLYISSDVGKSKSTGHLYDFVQRDLGADGKHWYHQGDNRHSDYKVPRKKGIKAKLINHPLSYYERKAIEYDMALTSSDVRKLSAVSRAIRLSTKDEPVYRFAADFIAPLMTTFVHYIFEDAKRRGLQHLYFIARDACILYHIAQQLIHLYPDITIHYLYASRQSLYKPDENCLPYLHQEGLTRPHSAIVDMVGSRRCQQCINGLFQQNGFPLVFAYYFEVTPYRIMSTDPYLAMYYQEQLAGSPHYHHASHPLFEQYFGITDQYRTIGYQKDGDKVAPIYEPDLMDADYKHHVFTVNKEICCSFAKYYAMSYIIDPARCNNILFAVFAHFCHVPRLGFLMALKDFFSTSSETEQEQLLTKRNLASILFNKQNYLRWKQGNLIYNSGILYRPIIAILQWYHNNKKYANHL